MQAAMKEVRSKTSPLATSYTAKALPLRSEQQSQSTPIHEVFVIF